MQPGTRTTSSRRASSPMGQVAAPRVPHLDRQLWPVPGGCARSSVHLICCFFAMRWLTGLAQRTHRTARFPLLARAAARPQPRARHLDLAKHSPRHDRSVVLVRQHGGARLRTLEAGFDNQSHGNSERLARFSSLAEATCSEKSPRHGRWVPRSDCSLQIHMVQNPGNRLPRFGSLSRGAKRLCQRAQNPILRLVNDLERMGTGGFAVSLRTKF
jgi:hypothetical protein